MTKSAQGYLRTAFLSLMVMVSSSVATHGQSSTKLRVGVLKVAGQTNAFVAQEQGFLKKRGLDVDLVIIRSGSEGISAMQGGSLDMIISIPSFGIVANERGFNLVVALQNQIAATTPPDSGAVLVARDSNIRSPEELKDKVIGINALHAQEVVSAQHALRKLGVTKDKIKYIEVPYASMGDVLKRGDVAAVVAVEPFVTTIQQRGMGRVIAWAYHDAIPAQPTGAYFAKRAWAETNLKTIEQYSAAIDEANDYLTVNPERARAFVSKFTGLAPELVAAMPMISWSTKVDAAKWADLIAMLKAEDEIKKDQRPEDFILPLMSRSR